MYICPICGYDKLDEKPYDNDGNPSYEICPCCGFEFGFDDESEGKSFEGYREEWLHNGVEWFDLKLKPKDWNLKTQLKNINILME
jgi:hypothetical protein